MEADFKEYPKTLPDDDFWRQVKRTVHGQAVSEAQIEMIVAAVRQALMFSGEDHLLDLGCGNGALSQYFFDQCRSFLGVDFSPVLIDVARRHFARPNCQFLLDDACHHVMTAEQSERFTKVLCYGCFSYFKEETAQQLLQALNQRYPNVSRVFIGNLPDLDRHLAFYTDGCEHQAELKDAESKIGIWRTAREFTALARQCGWEATMLSMPADFYAAHYRYDVLLTRPVRPGADQ